MLIELRRHFEELRYDMDVRVVILKGAGRAFCTGMDMKQGDRGNKRAAAAQAASRQKVRTGLYNGNHWWSAWYERCALAHSPSLLVCTVTPWVAALPLPLERTSALPSPGQSLMYR